MKKITVIITAFNRTLYIMEAFHSVVTQHINGYEFEIIVVKNFTLETVDSFIESHNWIKVDGGDTPLCDYVFRGIQQSTGEFIFFLEDDDLFLPEKIIHVIEKMRNLDLDFYHNAYIPRDNKQRTIKGKLYNQLKQDLMINSSNISYKQITKIMKIKGDINLSSMCINRRIVDDKFKKLSILSAGPDWFMLFSALENGKRLFFDHEALSIYRIHDSTVNSPSSNIDSFMKNRIKLLKKEIYSLGVMYDLFVNTEIRRIINARLNTDLVQCEIIESNKRLILFSKLFNKKVFFNVRNDFFGKFLIFLYLLKLISPKITLNIYYKILKQLSYGK